MNERVIRGGPVFEIHLAAGNHTARVRKVFTTRNAHYSVSIDGVRINSFLTVGRATSYVRKKLAWADRADW